MAFVLANELVDGWVMGWLGVRLGFVTVALWAFVLAVESVDVWETGTLVVEWDYEWDSS